MSFDSFYRTVTGFEPFPYQRRLAEGELPAFLAIPTGLGKTAALVLGWRYRRLTAPASTPRRLVYCLPMRSLVDQVAENCRRWVERERAQWPERSFPSIHVLMGGEKDETYINRPEDDAILIGTQDMLLSRALNRGYGMSRYAWPMSFALLNNDVLWVFDETQLQGVGIETSAQLHALRHGLGYKAQAQTIWASATLSVDRVATVDHRPMLNRDAVLSLSEADLNHPIVRKRVSAVKSVAWAPFGTPEKLDGIKSELATHVSEKHVEGTLTLVVLNRVNRAQELHKQLEKLHATKRKADPNCELPSLALIHSRFRAADRALMEKVLLGGGDRIVIATQAVEAGVDVSARTLITELAPWSSLVQRFGRCNRQGEFDEAEIEVIAINHEKPAECLPYAAEELARAEQTLNDQIEIDATVSIDALEAIDVPEPTVVRPILRRRDLVELFDTTPDLLGMDLDVSSYIRDGDDTDVQFYWRDFEAIPAEDIPRPTRAELCRVSISDARSLVDKAIKAFNNERKKSKPTDQIAWMRPYVWDGVENRWQVLQKNDVRPGLTVLLSTDLGGYSPDSGFTGTLNKDRKKAISVPVLNVEGASLPSLRDERESRTGVWVGLHDHLQHVHDECEAIMETLPLSSNEREILQTAALWHDVGKAHEVFQTMLHGGDAARNERLWAKSDSFGRRSARPYFRHELASALAYLDTVEASEARDVTAWLIASHHGKVRSSLRSVPGEKEAPDGRLFARGLWDGDVIPAVDVPFIGEVGPFTLSLSRISMGEGSWTELATRLRDAAAWGPFRLAYLETILRSGDQRASAKEAM